MLEREPDFVVQGEAQDGQEALELCRKQCPDLVLMDVQMPRMDGLAATRAIKEVCPQTSVLMLTGHERQDYLLQAVRAGAAGYILKGTSKERLVNAVRRVLNGETPLNQELAMRLLRRAAAEAPGPARSAPALEDASEDRRGREPPPQALTELLAPREIEVLRLVVAGKTNREIGQALMLSWTTVKTHVQRIIRKLGVSDRTQAAVRAVELGLTAERAEEK